MSIWDRFKAHPTIASIVGLAASALAFWTVVQVIETIWSYFNSDPLIPVVGQWVGDRTDQLLAVFLLIGGVAIVGWMVYIQFRLFSLLRGPQMMEDELPGDLTVLEGKLNAGTDFTMTLKMPGADETRKVTFSARQNDRVIARNKAGSVDRGNSQFLIPFSEKETRKLESGYMLVQVAYTTKEGNRATVDPVVVKTVGQIVV